MEDIVVVKSGIEPTLYFKHVCTQCDALLEIKSSIKEFKCPGCESEEICVQSPETMVKKYIREGMPLTPRQLGKNASSKGLLKKSKK